LFARWKWKCERVTAENKDNFSFFLFLRDHMF
jgi:hypothetical protein